MNKEAMISDIQNKFDELKASLEGDDLEKMKSLSLELHAMVHPAEFPEERERPLPITCWII